MHISQKIATQTLVQNANEMKMDILFIKEPHTLNDRVNGFSLHFQVFQCESDVRPKAAIILLKKNLNLIKLNYCD
jgi:hypothetical protein